MPRNFVIILLILFDIFILFVLRNHINTTYTEDRNDNIPLKIIHNITAKKTLNIAFYLKILPVYDGGQTMEFDWITNVLLGKIDRPLKIISGDEAKYNPQNDTLHVGFTYPSGDFYSKLKERGFVNQGAFHMGDEVNAHDVAYYTTASYVFRNYYNKDYEQRFSNSHFVPLGTKSGYGSLPENSLLPSSQRIYVANFIGSLKENGKEMVDKIKERNFTSILA